MIFGWGSAGRNRKLRKFDIVAWALSQALKLYQEKGKESQL